MKSPFARPSPWDTEEHDESLFYASEETLRQPRIHEDLEASLARIEAKLAPAKAALKPIPTDHITWALDEPIKRRA